MIKSISLSLSLSLSLSMIWMKYTALNTIAAFCYPQRQVVLKSSWCKGFGKLIVLAVECMPGLCVHLCVCVCVSMWLLLKSKVAREREREREVKQIEFSFRLLWLSCYHLTKQQGRTSAASSIVNSRNIERLARREKGKKLRSNPCYACSMTDSSVGSFFFFPFPALRHPCSRHFSS